MTKKSDRRIADRLDRIIALLTPERTGPAKAFFTIRGTIRDAGGGELAVLIDRDTDRYPPAGARVLCTFDQDSWDSAGSFHPPCGEPWPENGRHLRNMFCQLPMGHDGPHRQDEGIAVGSWE